MFSNSSRALHLPTLCSPTFQIACELASGYGKGHPSDAGSPGRPGGSRKGEVRPSPGPLRPSLFDRGPAPRAHGRHGAIRCAHRAERGRNSVRGGGLATAVLPGACCSRRRLPWQRWVSLRSPHRLRSRLTVPPRCSARKRHRFHLPPRACLPSRSSPSGRRARRPTPTGSRPSRRPSQTSESSPWRAIHRAGLRCP